jgi:hypothetical protein
MKLYRIPTTVVIADLVKSVGAAFIYMGEGICADSNGKVYDQVYLGQKPKDINAAINWCKTATAYIPGLVGVSVGNGWWHCHYDNGSLSSIDPKSEFTPTATVFSVTAIGTGAVATIVAKDLHACFKNEVRTADRFQLHDLI